MQGIISSVGNIVSGGGQGGGLESFILFDITLPSASGIEPVEYRPTTYYNISRNRVNVYRISPLGDQESMSLDDLFYYDLKPTSNNNYSAGMTLDYDGSNFTCKVNLDPSMTSISRMKFLFLFNGRSEPLSSMYIKNYVDLAMLRPEVEVPIPAVDTTRTYYLTTRDCTCTVNTSDNICQMTVPATSIRLYQQGNSPRFITPSEWTTLINTSNFKIAVNSLVSNWKFKISSIQVTLTGVVIEGENFHEIANGTYSFNSSYADEYHYIITFTETAEIIAVNPTTSKVVDFGAPYILSTEGLYVRSCIRRVFFNLINGSTTIGRCSMIAPTQPVKLGTTGYYSRAPVFGNIVINGETRTIMTWRKSSSDANTIMVSSPNGTSEYTINNVAITYLFY